MTLRKRARFWFLILSISLLTSLATISQTAYSSESNTVAKQNQSTNVDFRHYYYNQLNELEREIYNNLILSKEGFLNNEEVVFAIHPDNNNKQQSYLYLITRAVRAFTYDNPEVSIWFENYDKAYFRTGDSSYITLKPKNPNELNTSLNANTIREGISKFERISLEFVHTLSGTDVEKLKTIHNWLLEHCEYDHSYTLPDTKTVYGTIVERRSVCSGFAASYKYLADLAGLQVLYVTGEFYDSKTGEFFPHAWNIVYVNNQYYIVDVTMDGGFSDQSTFLLTPVNNNIHHVDNYYFDYSNF